MTPKERIYAIIEGKPYDRCAVTPIFMAWAANFAGHSYRDYYLDGDVLVESQTAVTKAFNLDQLSAISDPWREASAYGMQFDYPEEGVGKPKGILIRTPGDISLIKKFDITKAARPKQRIESVGKMARTMGQTHSILGWVEGPMAMYADLRGLENTMLDLIDKPEIFQQAGQILVENAIAFARAQIEAGADMVGVGDAAASIIGPDLYRRLVLNLEQKLFAAIHEAGAKVKLHICGNITNIIEYMAESDADIIDVDWMLSLDKARQLVGDKITLCGNFDPSAVLLQGSPQDVADAAKRCIQTAGDRFVLMPGCEVPPGTPEENIRSFCPCDGCLIDGGN